MKGLLTDSRHAWRVYARTPIASGLAIVVLAIAMAFVSSFLSLYLDLVFTPHPGFADSSALVTVGQNDGDNLMTMSPLLIDRINEEVTSLSVLSGSRATGLQVGSNLEQQTIEMLAAGFFSDIRPRLELGRGFDEQDHDPAAEPVAVISYRYWQSEFGGSPDVIDEMLQITGRQQFFFASPDGEPPSRPQNETTDFRIVGVMGEDLESLQAEDTIAWLPFEVGAPRYFGPWDRIQSINMLRGIGRLADGASPSAVAAELDSRYPDNEDISVVPEVPFDAMAGIVVDINSQREARRQLNLFLAGSVLLAIVAAANVSLFLLSRAPGRRRELGIRMSVGAPLKRLGRQLATEAALIVLLSTALGLVISFWLQGFLQGLAFLSEARWQGAALFDWRVLGIMFAFLAVLTLLVSLAPVFGLKKLGIASSSRQVATRANLTQRTACTAQIAIAGTVAAAAVAFGWYLSLILAGDHGYAVDDIYLLTLTEGEGAPGFIGFDQLESNLVERERKRDMIGALPGIEMAGFGSNAPGMNQVNLNFGIPHPLDPDESVNFRAISADRNYFEMLDIEFLGGRAYDNGQTDALIVNRAAAEMIWGRVDVVGETLPISFSDAESSEVIGVVADISHTHPEDEVEPRAYQSIFPIFGVDFVLVKTVMSPADLREQVQTLIDSGDLEVVIDDIDRLEDLAAEFTAADRARGSLTITTALIVVLLAGLGFYGTQRYLVAAGRREYAIRASMGAGPRALGRLVMLRGVALGLPGIILGGLLAFIVAAWLRDDFVSREVSPGIVTAGVAFGLVLLLVIASVGPARRARQTQPAPVLREE